MASKKDVGSLQHQIKKKVLGSVLVNLVLGAAGGYWVASKSTVITYWDEHGVAADILLTGFFLTYIVCALFAHRFRKNREQWGDQARVAVNAFAYRLPIGIWRASLVLGLLALLPSLMLIAAMMAVSSVFPLSPIHYGLIKSISTAVLAAYVVRMSISVGLRRPEIRSLPNT